MPKMSIDTYTEYLELAEIVDAKQRYSKQDIEAMGLFICKVYGDQFTVEELKNPETGLDAAGLILEFQFIDMGIADDLTKRMEKIEKNFQSLSLKTISNNPTTRLQPARRRLLSGKKRKRAEKSGHDQAHRAQHPRARCSPALPNDARAARRP